MFIVVFGHTRHSAWTTSAEASKQAQTLLDNGYKAVKIIFDETVQTDNGHYYV